MAVRFSPGQMKAREVLSGPQRYTCLVGGTRSGKSLLAVRAIVHRALRGPGSRHAVLRFRANTARASIALDTLPAVMNMCFPGVAIAEHRQDGYFEFSNGSQIWIGGLDEKDRVEKILGLEFATVFLNEASQIPYASALMAMSRCAQVVVGLRQRCIVDLNPPGKSHWTNQLFGEKRDPISRAPIANPEQYARAFLNPADNAHNLSAEFIADLQNKPEKFRKRFFEGVYVDEVEDALWTYEGLEKGRRTLDDIPESQRASVVVAVDPSGASSRQDENADEIGIVAAARGRDGHGYILADRSTRCGPREWARVAVAAFHEFRADCIVAESNYGGAMVEATIKAVDRNVPVRLVTASRGKAVRAEPISVRYEQGDAHHAGRFPVLEDQLCSFSSSGYIGENSPDHADAAIWALTHLLGVADGTAIIEWTRGQIERAEQAPMREVAPRADLVCMRPPDGVSTAFGMKGQKYLAGQDGLMWVEKDDVAPLRGAGFIEIEDT